MGLTRNDLSPKKTRSSKEDSFSEAKVSPMLEHLLPSEEDRQYYQENFASSQNICLLHRDDGPPMLKLIP